MTDNPWKTLDTRIVYRNPWITVREDRVIRPDGQEGIYGVVEAKIATGVVALTDDDQIWLVGQYRYPMQEYSWEIIEGGTDEGETPEAAARRELEEEAGLVAARFEPLGDEIHLSNCFTSERGRLFLARDLRHTASRPEATEQLALRKLPFAECLAMVDRGEIKDAMSIIGILRASRARSVAG